jgi:outer membrane receptor protein involved in Fe transport
MQYKIAIRPAAVGLLIVAAMGDPIRAQSPNDAGTPGQLEEILVTAQKRSQGINDVGMSITALTGTELADRGVSDVADLEKVVPGFSYAEAPNGRPVFTLRGVGFYDTSLAASPTTSVYVDEVPLPFSTMTRGADLDVQRVEVLKGPQGTLFGENSTGGAINFVANRPTRDFGAGFDTSFSRFATADVAGGVSGPLTDTLSARLSVRSTEGAAWQYDYTRPGAKTGAPKFNEGRLLLDWTPTERLRVSLNLNGYLDQSESQAAQLVAVAPQVPGVLSAGFLNYPLPPANDRAASWGPESGSQYRRDDRFQQAALTAKYDLGGGNEVTSISSFEKYICNTLSDYDGTTYQDLDLRTPGWISTVGQELRLSHSTAGLNWIIGGNFEEDRTYDEEYLAQLDASNSYVGPVFADTVIDRNNQQVHTYAGFGNADLPINDQITAHVGARFTQTNRTFAGCSADAGNGQWVAAINFLSQVFTGHPANPPLAPGACITFSAQLVPAEFTQRLDQNNVSWRTGVDWKPDGVSLIYGTVSRGYKAGSFPTEAAITASAYHAVPQESLIAYEIGAKAPFLDNTLRLSPALFYYDYLDKQLRGNIVTPFFGITDALISVPKSYVKGAELAAEWAPVKGLQLNVGATYIIAKITQYTGYNEVGVESNFAGSRLPFAPALEVVGDGQYTWNAWAGYSAFAGLGTTHHSQSNGGFGSTAVLNIKPYTTLDLRAGFETPDSKWRLTFWGRNVTNEYYWTNATHANDDYVKFTGMPATFGVTANYRYK